MTVCALRARVPKIHAEMFWNKIASLCVTAGLFHLICVDDYLLFNWSFSYVLWI